MSVSDNNFEQSPQLLLLFFLFSLIGMLCEISVIIIFLYKKYYTNYAFLLVFYLITANLILSLGYSLSGLLLIDSIHFVSQNNSFFCILQTILINIGQLSSMIWSTIVAYILIISFSTNEIYHPTKNLFFLVFGFVVPIFMTIFPFILGQNGNSGYYCWLDIFTDINKNTIFTLIQFMVPAFLCIIYNIIIIIRIGIKINQLSAESIISKRFIFYPLAMILCWSFRLIFRIILITNKAVPEWTILATLITTSVQGIINSFLYATNIMDIKCIKKKEQQRQIQIQLIDYKTMNRRRVNSNPLNQKQIRRLSRTYSISINL